MDFKQMGLSCIIASELFISFIKNKVRNFILMILCSAMMLAITFSFEISNAADSLSCIAVFQHENKKESQFNVLRELSKFEKASLTDEEFSKKIDSWFFQVKSEGLPSVTEFTALQLLLKIPDTAEILSPQLREQMKEYLVQSWWRFTGAQPKDFNTLLKSKLPDRVLQLESKQVIQLHRLASKIDPVTLTLSHPPMVKMALKWLPVTLLAVGLSNAMGDVVSGSLIGYVNGSMFAYWLHRMVLHRPARESEVPKLLKGFSKDWIRSARWHLAHHAEQSAAGNGSRYEKPIGSDSLESDYAKSELIPKLKDKGFSTADVEEYIVTTKHGLTVAPAPARFGLMAVGVPSAILAGMISDNIFVGALSGFLASYSWILHVDLTHPEMHERVNQANGKTQFEEWYFNTLFFRWTSRFHFMHHRKAANYTLLPGGPDALFGTQVDPKLSDLLDMFDQGFHF